MKIRYILGLVFSVAVFNAFGLADDSLQVPYAELVAEYNLTQEEFESLVQRLADEGLVSRESPDLFVDELAAEEAVDVMLDQLGLE